MGCHVTFLSGVSGVGRDSDAFVAYFRESWDIYVYDVYYVGLRERDDDGDSKGEYWMIRTGECSEVGIRGRDVTTVWCMVYGFWEQEAFSGRV